MKIVFFGTPDIAVPSLEHFINSENVEVLAVVTQPDKPAGRGKKITPPPTKVIAEKHNIPVLQPKLIRKDTEVINTLKNLNADVFITVAFGQILSQEIIDIPKFGIVNLHASILPKYRGANPIQWPIINGDSVTGVSTMLTEIGVDTGAILLTEEIKINENMTSIDLYEEISKIGPDLLDKTIFGLQDNSIKPITQNEDEATHARKLKKEDGLINWNDSSENIHNKVRGMKPWPSTYTNFKGNIIKICETRLIKENKQNIKTENIGEIIGIMNSGIKVFSNDGEILVTKVQPAGKPIMDAKNWYNGARITAGEKFTL